MKKLLFLPFLFIFLLIPICKCVLYEDFYTFTEVDPIAFINVISSTEVKFESHRFYDIYLYKNYGADYFTDFSHDVDFNITEINDNGDWWCGWCLSNFIQDVRYLETNNKTHIYIKAYKYSDARRFKLQEHFNGSNYVSNGYVFSLNTKYYMRLEKNGVSFTCKIYSDADRTILLDTLSLTLQADYSFRFLFSAISYNTANLFSATGYIYNLKIVESVVSNFYLTNGGYLRVDNATVSNGSETEYPINTILELIALPKNASYYWLNFTVIYEQTTAEGTFNTTNIYTENIYNLTLGDYNEYWTWCYFDLVSEANGYVIGGIGIISFYLNILLFGLAIMFMIMAFRK